MDDIAEKCGISKKTIYRHFQNKDDLLYEAIKLEAFEVKKNIDRIRLKNDNALEELQKFFKYINNVARVISPSFGRDLKKYHNSNLFKAITFKDKIIIPFVIGNLEKGKREGLYKEDIDAVEICKSYDELSNAVYFNYYFTDSSINSKSLEFLSTLFLYGLVSKIGWEHLHKP
ncbi:hypothetical protein ULMS_19390 [Patiriisocius marinistellae]|uniref:HTH tetR-type domain-containing protein n=2 Tax=Patiriisocius marinistellae TaxID=2494560 RepID=A0A5J4G2K6_9FLAO|nr:hypothetical protein ULMS_19390 [Patiriisocius marinistellae]